MDNSETPQYTLAVTERAGSNYFLPIVYFPGWGYEASVFTDFHERQFKGFKAIFVDLPGMGVNRNLGAHSVEDFLAALSDRLPRVFIAVGWSLGGMLAVRFASQYSNRVRALVTFAASPSFIERSEWHYAMPEATYDQFCSSFAESPLKTIRRFQSLQAQGDAEQKKILKVLREHMVFYKECLAACRSSLAWLGEIDNRRYISTSNVPCLHVYGEFDALVPSQVANLSLSSTSQVYVVNGRGHCLLHFPDCEMLRAVTRFVEASKQMGLSKGDAVQMMCGSWESQKPERRDKKQLSRSFSRAAHTYDQAAGLQRRVGKCLLSLFNKVELYKEVPDHFNVGGDNSELDRKVPVLDLGCGTGEWLSEVKAPDIQWHAIDIAEGMLVQAASKYPSLASWACADAERLPYKSSCFTGVTSNLALQWSENLFQTVQEVARVLVPGGWFLFSTLGERTLYELKDSWAEIDQYVHVNQFQTSDAIRQEVQNAGLELEQVECRVEESSYKTLIMLMKDLKRIGAHNINAGKNAGLTSVGKLRALEKSYEKYRRSDGLLPSTYEVIYIIARKPNS